MRNSEEAMEKVVAGLRDAEAPAGMERRILNALEERVAARSRPGWRQMLPVWLVVPARPMGMGSLVCGVALAGLLAVVLAPAIRRPGRAPAQARKSAPPVESAASGALEVEAKSVLPASARPGVRFLAEKKSEGEANAGGTEASLDIDSVALEDMHAPSRPAPPMPLTEQERLLLRLVHKDDPVELAMLDSKVRDLQELEDKAEFQRFFGQSTKQALPEQPMMEQAMPEQSTTEQAVPGKTGTEPSVPEQPLQEQQRPDQPRQPQAAPERVGPDQSTTQEATPRPTRTGDNK